MSKDSTDRNYSFCCPGCGTQITITVGQGHGIIGAKIESRLDSPLNERTEKTDPITDVITEAEEAAFRRRFGRPG